MTGAAYKDQLEADLAFLAKIVLPATLEKLRSLQQKYLEKVFRSYISNWFTRFCNEQSHVLSLFVSML